MAKNTRIKKVNNEYKEQTKELFVHFNTKEHRITLEQFVQTVNSYEVISKDIAEQVFGVKKGIKIYILPPKEGSFELSMLLCLSSMAIAGIVGNMTSDIVKGFVRGMTKRLNPEKYPNGFDLEQAAEALGDTVTGFVMETAEDVNRIEASIDNAPNIDISIKAKADFYGMCSKDKTIEGLGFTSKKNFDFKRADFVPRAVAPSIKPLPVKEELKELIIVKPVNVEEDLQWDLKDKNTKEALTAKMADDNFKTLLFEGKCPLRKFAVPDVILAKVEYYKSLKNGKESKDEYIITDVYKFNKDLLKTVPSNLKLNRKRVANGCDGQLNLFKDNDSKNLK